MPTIQPRCSNSSPVWSASKCRFSGRRGSAGKRMSIGSFFHFFFSGLTGRSHSRSMLVTHGMQRISAERSSSEEAMDAKRLDAQTKAWQEARVARCVNQCPCFANRHQNRGREPRQPMECSNVGTSALRAGPRATVYGKRWRRVANRSNAFQPNPLFQQYSTP